MTTGRIISGILVCLCLLGTGTAVIASAVAVNTARESATRTFLREYLRALHFSGTVRIGQTGFLISDGVVTSTSTRVSARQELAALRLGYAYERAVKYPLLDIAGTEPADLRAAVIQLEKSTSALLVVQDSDGARTHIKNLYPASYLRKLADTEDARREFIRTGSDSAERAYSLLLASTVREAMSDLGDFRDSFGILTGKNRMKLISYSGISDTVRMTSSLADIDAGMNRVSESLQAQKKCLLGATEFCELPPRVPPLVQEPKKALPQGALARFSEVRSLTASAPYTASQRADMIPIVLSASKCLTALDGIHAVALRPNRQMSSSELLYVADMLLIPNATTGSSTSAYLRNKLGLTYSVANPFNFYVCPEVGADVSNASTTLATAVYARHNPTIAPRERRPLLSKEILYESDARAYVRAALKATSPTSTKELLVLERMFRSQSAGFDQVVGNVAHTMRHDADLARAKVPFNLKPRNLFLTHSAFPSLFQSYNPSFGSSQLPLSYPDSLAHSEIYAQNLSYFKLLNQESAASLQSKIRAYLTFERSTTTKPIKK